ncbi:hypothetical protein M0812_11320 [Anaeramoeba flamelloides]|uniref:Uncharacterized protein n=1 Tax=Anaeramoeba flamelloides TaxID=1746091 RepID=A0AAV7ZWE4_9EUKA|nr:hypothetical protein M0812_11320 [Anaeramoeba flamelloides]
MPDWHRIKTFLFGYGEDDYIRLDNTLWDYLRFYVGTCFAFLIEKIINPCYTYVEGLNLPVPTVVVLLFVWALFILCLTIILDKIFKRLLKGKRKTKISERPIVVITGADNKQSMSLYELLRSGDKPNANVDLNEEMDKEFPLNLAPIEEITELQKEMVEKHFQVVYLPFQKRSGITNFANVVDYVIFVTNQTAQIATKGKTQKKGTKNRSKNNSQKEKEKEKENKRFDLMKSFFGNKKLIDRKPKFLVVSVDNESKVTPKLVQQDIKQNVPNSPKFDVIVSSFQKKQMNQILFYLLGMN